MLCLISGNSRDPSEIKRLIGRLDPGALMGALVTAEATRVGVAADRIVMSVALPRTMKARRGPVRRSHYTGPKSGVGLAVWTRWFPVQDNASKTAERAQADR
jgi:hypothetical protein